MANFEKMFAETEIKKSDPHPRKEAKWLHYTKLVNNAKQYRSDQDRENIIDLASLIEADEGVTQNLIVRKIDTDRYEIIAGHHRCAACKYLAEERGLKQYEFLPCEVVKLDEVRAEFQLYSSNGFIPKTDYEIMHELERMRYLITNFPEEFPHLQSGRMVERLATQTKMNKTTVGEYLTISKNLGEKGMEAFKEGSLKKSAAVEMAALPEKEQEKLLDQGVTSQKDIENYKVSKEPSDELIRKFYEESAKEFDSDRSQLKELLKEYYGKSHAGCFYSDFSYKCSPRGIKLGNAAEITWARLVQRINLLFPPETKDQEEKKESAVLTENTDHQLPGQLCVANTDMEIKEDVPESGTQEGTESHIMTAKPEDGETDEMIEETSDPEQYNLCDVGELLEAYTEELHIYKQEKCPPRTIRKRRILLDALMLLYVKKEEEEECKEP